jgi:hypothetical protein
VARLLGELKSFECLIVVEIVPLSDDLATLLTFVTPICVSMPLVAFVSPNRMGLVNLDRLVVTPAPSGTGGSSGPSRMPAVKGAGELRVTVPRVVLAL